MSKETKEVKKITLGLVFSWIFGIIFFFVGVGIISDGSHFSGILIMLCSAMIIPYFNKIVAEKFHFEISGGIKFALVVIIFILIGIAASNTPSNSNTTLSSIEKQNTSSNTTVSSSEKINQKKEVKTYNLGDTIQAGDFKWKVTRASTTTEIGQNIGGYFIGKKADGIYLILEVEIENTGKSASYLTDSYLKIVDEQNREFSPDSTAALYLKPENSALIFEQINPGIIKKGKIVFDVPTNVKVANLKISSNLLTSSLYTIKLTI